MDGIQKPANSLTTPVPRGSLVNFVVERIKEALINKEIKPGDYLPAEAELAKNLNVGKSSVREALKMLQALGVVVVRRGQGTVICKKPGEDSVNPLIFQLIMEDRSPQDLIDLRMIFEPGITVMAMKRATDAEIETIRKTVERLEKSIEEGAPAADDDLAFHFAILKATRNPFVIRIGDTILQLFKSSISTSMRTIPEIALRDHKRIFEAFVQKDEEKLVEAVVASFEGWEKSLRRSSV
ncbi:MAG: FadR family transcriptional regulator [Desulfobacterales bacterium]|nr:MAG: FadR family transcriptional regulator [Desulfobacterales bacterium]